ncbi:hypothetical protein ACEW7V_02675 [Areca yellow leaf disease phytoplasma]|uniref:hypothetical protein n=1 Tax=Areca yellow leaf disease phytoplasma TaxID=927614 RepID=UPI0035B52C4D
MVKCFEDPNIAHVTETNNPVEEIDIIQTELALADLEQIEKRLLKLGKQKNKLDKELLQEKVLLTKIKTHSTTQDLKNLVFGMKK